MSKKIVTMLSGGMDSTTLLYYLATQFRDSTIHALSFNYNQRHGNQELKAANEIIIAAQDRFTWRIDHHVIDLSSVMPLLTGSSLTDPTVPVPEGHYADETMRQTVVPNRNMMMLSIAASVAVAEGAQILAFGPHGGDHPIYPDCRPVFVDVMNLAIKLGNDSYIDPTFAVFAPFVNKDKTYIAELGAQLKVPFELTWSCYQGRQRHCGKCGTCVERKEAFQLAGVPDPTVYEGEPVPA